MPTREAKNPHTITREKRFEFQRRIYSAYKKDKRVFPWRTTRDPYKILLSEIMLQQTQAGSRTIEKYEVFLKRFPTLGALAKAPLSDVLILWQGLGYNRRAKALHETACILVNRYNAKVPQKEETLMTLPGVGPYTAGAVCAFAFNKPTVLIETNIRSVYIHEFFSYRKGLISDSEIVPLTEATLDQENPREWYAALMDYGAGLKHTGENPGRKSKHYKKQSAFKGSDRQIRGSILRELSQGKETLHSIHKKTSLDKTRIEVQLNALLHEGLVERTGRSFTLPR